MSNGRAAKARNGAFTSLPSNSMPKPSPPQSAPIGASKTGSTGCSTLSSTTTSQDCEPDQDPRIWPSSNRSPFTWCEIQTTNRSEEHTSELQSLMRISYAVFCLNKTNQHKTINKHRLQ